MKFVQWPLMGRLYHVTAHPLTASVPLLHNGPLLCGFKGSSLPGGKLHPAMGRETTYAVASTTSYIVAFEGTWF